ncbi:MAG: hypothetical protein HWD59_11455 [Coxiellaceae bacterium]|nr:MAG: hypothetical protein HWD59_11455 [Coxiellaceae bacterium]
MDIIGPIDDETTQEIPNIHYMHEQGFQQNNTNATDEQEVSMILGQ